MSPPRLVATDLDGTLLGGDGALSERTREVLAALDERGVLVVFVTGRPLRWMTSLLGDVGHHGLAVLSNGALVYDVARERTRDVLGIERAAGLELVEAVREQVPGVRFALECVSGIRTEPGFVDVDRIPAGSAVGPVEEIWDEPALKVLVRHPSLDAERFHDAIAAAVGERATPTWSMPGLAEISAPEVTKASTLARICAELGVGAEEVVAFGDMPNDLAMLTWAGTSYAMAGGHPLVLDAADHVAPDHDDDGVARVLSEIFGL